MPQGRFAAFPYPDALVVLDTETGEVVRVPLDGSAQIVLRAGAAPASTRGRAPVIAAPVSALDREVLATYPFPLAHAYAMFLGEKEPRQRARLLIDTFGIALKLWALILVSQYLAAKEPSAVETREPGDALLDDLLAREFRRPLISTWDQAIQRALAVFKDRGVVPFVPEIRAAYEALEIRCREPFLATVTYEDEDGQKRQKRSKLGKVRALLRYRNTLAHGFVQTPEQAESELALYEPLLRDVIRAGDFMRRYGLHSIADRDASGRILVRRWMGSEQPTEVTPLGGVPFDTEASPFFLRAEATGELLPLHGFVDAERSTSEDHLLLYDGLSRGGVVYVSSSGARVERTRRATTLVALLDQRATSLPSAAVDAMSTTALATLAARTTARTLDRLSESGRFIPEVVQRRKDIEETLASFREGNYRGLVLAGEGGAGKTTVAATFASERVRAGDVVVFFRGQDLADSDIDARLLRALGVRGMPFEDFLAAANGAFATSERRLYLVVDGVNETPAEVAALVRSFDALVAQADSFAWFRAIATIRTRSLERLGARARFGEDARARYLSVETKSGAREPLVTLSPLSIAEVGELYEAYRGYRAEPSDAEPRALRRFRPLTPFSDIDPLGSTCALMKNPLILRVVIEAYHQKRLPPELRFDQAMDLFLDQVVLEQGSVDGPYPERRRVLAEVVRVLDTASASSIAVDKLYEVAALRRAVENTERDSPYVQLVDLGVLVESWDEHSVRVRFSFDRLFEDQLARLHEPGLHEPADLLGLASRAVGFQSLRGALALLAARAVHHGRAEFLVDAVMLADGEARAILLGALADGLTSLARSRDASAAELLSVLRREATAERARLLLEVADRLMRVGETKWAEDVLVAVGSVVSKLEMPILLAEEAERRGQLAQQRGDWATALELLGGAAENALLAGDEALAMRAELQTGEILRSQGHQGRASEIFERAAVWFSAHGELARASEARRQQAIVEGQRGALETRRALITEAVDLAERSGDRDAAFRAYLSLGQTHRLLGEAGGAVRWFTEALAAAEALGNARQIASALLGLGVALRESRERTKAEALFARAVGVLERVDDRVRLAAALHNLALARMDSGHVDEALVLSTRSVAAYESLGEQGDVIEAKNLQGALLSERGETERARGIHEEALAIAKSTGHSAGMQNALFHLGCLDAGGGRLDEARRAWTALDEMRAKEPSALGELTSASLLVVLAAEEPAPRDLEAAVVKLRDAREKVTCVPDLHAGPAVAWRAAARRASGAGDSVLSESCARELSRELDGRSFHA